MAILKKHSFHGQTLVFLPPGKPGLYIQRLQFFFFEYYELGIKGKHLCQRLFLMKTLLKTFIKMRLQHRCFPLSFARFLWTHIS